VSYCRDLDPRPRWMIQVGNKNAAL